MSTVPYFQAKELLPGTWQIRYRFAKEADSHVFCYLTEGRDYALLIDTMMGWGDLRAFCQTLTDKPLKLVNTHFHLDHTGGNFHFDACYLHHADIAMFFHSMNKSLEEVVEGAHRAALPEYADQLDPADFRAEGGMRVFPLYNGDLFDLGDRTLEVVLVGGHSAGSIALIDRAQRIAFTGDCCNGNTLLGFGNSLSVERYFHNLMNLKKHQQEVDILYGGHQVSPPSIIDDGIETCAKVLAGYDDHEERPGRHGPVIYAVRHAEHGFGRADGKLFNMTYNPDNRFDRGPQPQVITITPPNVF